MKFVFRKFLVRRDLEKIYTIMSDSNEQMEFQEKNPHNSIVEFENWILNQLRGSFHDFYIIEVAETEQMVGFLYSYNFRLNDGHCMICVYIKPEFRNVGVGMQCGIRFIHELFRDYTLRKIYLTVYDYNRQSLLSNLHAGFHEEGCYKDYRYFYGKFWDMHLLAIDRDVFYQLHEKYLEM